MKFVKENWVIITILLVIIYQLRDCSSPVNIGDISNPEVISVDTVTSIVTTTDTVYKWKDRVSVKTEYVWAEGRETSPGMDLSDTNEFHNYHYVYQHNDSSIKSNINVYSATMPDSVILDYSVLETVINDSTVITNDITQKVRVNQLYFGGNATVYPGFNSVSMGMDFVSRKGWQAEIGIGYNINNNHPIINVGYKKLISFRKKK